MKIPAAYQHVKLATSSLLNKLTSNSVTTLANLAIIFTIMDLVSPHARPISLKGLNLPPCYFVIFPALAPNISTLMAHAAQPASQDIKQSPKALVLVSAISIVLPAISIIKMVHVSPLAKPVISQDTKDNPTGSVTKLVSLLTGCTKMDLACRPAKLIMSKEPKLDLHISAISLVQLGNISLMTELVQPPALLIICQPLKMTSISALTLVILVNITTKTVLVALLVPLAIVSLMARIISAGNVLQDITIILTKKPAQQTVHILIQSKLIQIVPSVRVQQILKTAKGYRN